MTTTEREAIAGKGKPPGQGTGGLYPRSALNPQNPRQEGRNPMDNIDPDETPEDAIDQYNMWIDLALRKADLEDWNGLREMVQETPFASSYLYCAVRAYRDLLERYDRDVAALKQQLIQVAASRDDEVNALQAERDDLAEKLVFRSQNPN